MIKIDQKPVLSHNKSEDLKNLHLKYKAHQNDLMEIVKKSHRDEFAEEINFIEKLGG